MKVTEDGKPVKNLSVLSSASAEGIGTVLLIDASNSMKGSINSAMQAARRVRCSEPGPAALDRVLQLETDRRTAHDDQSARRSRRCSQSRRSSPRGRGSTTRSSPQSRRCGARRSARPASSCSPTATTSAAPRASTLRSRNSNAQKIRVYTVGIESPDFTPDDLQKIAEKTGGTYAAATSPEALTKIYDELGFKLGNEYLLRYRSSAQPDQKVDVEIAVKGVDPVSFAYTSPSTGTAAPYQPALRNRLLQSWFLIPLVVGLMLALVVFTVRSLWSLRSNKALVARLGDFVTLPAEERATERRREVDELLATVGKQKKQKLNFRWMEGFAEDVDVAQINHDPSRMVWASVLAGLLIAVLAGVLFSPFWIVLGVIPLIVLNLVVRGKARSVRKNFGEQLPENLDVLASALRAGHSLAGAMGVVADEAPEPSKREFRRVVTDESLGIPLDEALEVTAQRMQNSDIDQVAILALVQREAGGNTAEVLDQVTTNVRARMDVRRLVTVLTAQGKFSAVVVGLVPLGIFLFIMLANPHQLDPLFHQTIGQVAGISAIFMTLLGFYIIRRIVTIEL